MALIPPFFSDCVVAIGIDSDKPSFPNWVASAFLYGERVPGEREDNLVAYKIYLVTNKHVLNGYRRVFIRVNPQANESAKGYEASLVNHESGEPLWTGHSNKNVDVAVLPIRYDLLQEDKMQADYFRSDLHALDTKGMKLRGTSDGDGVFVLGFPMGLVGRKRNTVIVRAGIFARIRETLEKPVQPLLLDAAVFPGNSGGPAISRPEMNSIEGTQSQDRAELIGVVASYVPYRDVAVSPQTGNTRVVFEENSGLTHVYSVDTIRQTIKQHEKRNITAESEPRPSRAATDSAPSD